MTTNNKIMNQELEAFVERRVASGIHAIRSALKWIPDYESNEALMKTLLDLAAFESSAIKNPGYRPGTLEYDLLDADIDLMRVLKIGVEQQIGVAGRIHEMTLRQVSKTLKGSFLSRTLSRKCSRCELQDTAADLIKNTLTVTRLVESYVTRDHSMNDRNELRKAIIDAAKLCFEADYPGNNYSVSALWNISWFMTQINITMENDKEILARYA